MMRFAYAVWGLLGITVSYFAALHILISAGDLGLVLLFAGEGVLVVIALIHMLVNLKEDEA